MHNETAVIFSLSPERAAELSARKSGQFLFPRSPKLATPFLAFGFIPKGSHKGSKNATLWLNNGKVSLTKKGNDSQEVNGLVALQFTCTSITKDKDDVLYSVHAEDVKTLHFPRNLNTFRRGKVALCMETVKCSFISCSDYPCERVKVRPPTPYCFVLEIVRDNQ